MFHPLFILAGNVGMMLPVQPYYCCLPNSGQRLIGSEPAVRSTAIEALLPWTPGHDCIITHIPCVASSYAMSLMGSVTPCLPS